MPDAAQGECPRFTGYADVATHLALRRSLDPQWVWSSWRLVAVAFLFPFAGILLNGASPPFATILVLLAAGGMASLSCRFGAHWMESRRRKAYQAVIEREPRTGWVDADGIHMQRSEGLTILGWDDLSGLLDLGDAIGFIRDHCLVDELASSMFASPAEWQRARQMITEGMPAGVH